MTLVSDLSFAQTRNESGLVAIASFTFENKFRFTSVGICKRWDDGYYLSWPYRKTPLKKMTFVYPVDVGLNYMLEKEIITAYIDHLKKMKL